MNPERWKIIEDLFAQVVEIDKEKQLAWLDEHCADPGLKADVISILEGDRADTDPVKNVRRAIAEFAEHNLPPGTADLAGKIIGAYRLVKQIGVGGMGTVYLAERCDGMFEQQVAVKLLNPALLTEHTRQRFRAERQILADLDHPNIARLLDGGETDEGLPYLVLEYVEGAKIDGYCSREDLSIEDRCRLFVTVCDAVQFAHAHLIVHRDIKPSNILVSPQGKPKLLDFGIAKLLGDGDHGFMTMSIQGQPMTPQYASPEQRMGETVTTVSDVYSLGMLFYRLLAGELPGDLGRPTGFSGQEQISQPPSAIQSSDEDKHFRQRRDTRRLALRGDLDNIVMMAVREDPERRYASVDALADDVRRYLRNDPVAARADSWSYRARKFFRRHRQGLAVAMVMVMSLVITVMFYTNRLTDERDRAALEAEKANRISSFLVNIFRTADPVNQESGPLTAVGLLDQAVQSIRTELAGEPETRGQLLMVMGESYRELDQFDEALIVYRASVAALREADPDSRKVLIRSLMQLGVIHRLLGDYETALEPMLEASELGKLEENRSSELESWILNNLGLLYKELGRFDLAREYLQSSLQLSIEANGEIHPETADSMNNFAITLQQMGDYRLGAEYACRAAELGEQSLPRLHSNLATFINNCGLALRMLGRFDEARVRHMDSLARRSELSGVHSYETVFSYLALGELYRAWGQFDLSLEYLEKAHVSIQENLAPDAVEWIRYYRSLGRLQFARGDPGSATESFSRARGLSLDALGSDHLTPQELAVMEARALIREGRMVTAGTLLAGAGVFLDKRFDNKNFVKYRLQLARAEFALAQGNPVDARTHFSLALNNCEINIGTDSWCSGVPLAALNGTRL